MLRRHKISGILMNTCDKKRLNSVHSGAQMPELRPFSMIQAHTRSKSRINALYKSVYILLLNRKDSKYMVEWPGPSGPRPILYQKKKY